MLLNGEKTIPKAQMSGINGCRFTVAQSIGYWKMDMSHKMRRNLIAYGCISKYAIVLE